MAEEKYSIKAARPINAKPTVPLNKFTSAQLADHLVTEIEKWFAEVVIEKNKKNIQKLKKAANVYFLFF